MSSADDMTDEITDRMREEAGVEPPGLPSKRATMSDRENDEAEAVVRALATWDRGGGAEMGWWKAARGETAQWGERRIRRALAGAVARGLLEIVTHGRSREQRFKLTPAGDALRSDAGIQPDAGATPAPRTSLEAWIAEVDRARAEDDLIAEGDWHGYLAEENPPPGTPHGADSTRPMRGRYALVRWKPPTVCVSTDSTDATLAAAKLIERALRQPAEALPHYYRAQLLHDRARAAGVELVVRLRNRTSRDLDAQPYLALADIAISRDGTIIKHRHERTGRGATGQELDKAVYVPRDDEADPA